MKKRNLDLIAILLLLVLVVAWALPFFENFTYLAGEIDWLQLASIHYLLRDSLLHWGQFPLQTPFLGGGYPIFAHPQCDVLNPLFLFTLFCGEWVSLKLRVIFYLLLGAAGMFLFARRGLKYSRAGSVFSAGLLVFSTYYPYHVATGNLDVGLYFYLPLLLLCLIKSRERKRWLYLQILLWAHLLLGANGLFIPVMALFLGLYCLVSPLAGGGVRRAAILGRNLVIGILGGTLLAAVRVIPLIELLQRSGPRFPDYLQAQLDSVSPRMLYYSVLLPGPFLKTTPLYANVFPNGKFADSTMFFGVIPLLLALLAAFLYWRRICPWLILLAVFTVLMMGVHGPIDLFHYLWHLPVFHSMHLPNKYFSFPVAFIIALLPGSLFPLRVCSRKAKLRLLVLSLAGLAALFQMATASRRYFPDLFKHPVPPPAARGEPFFQVLDFMQIASVVEEASLPVYRPGFIFPADPVSFCLDMDAGGGRMKYPVTVARYNAAQYYFLRRNIGVIPWYGWLYLPEFTAPRYFVELLTGESFPNPDYRGEFYFSRPEHQAELKEFSPQRLEFAVSLEEPDTLVLNLNHDPNWYANRGELASVDGLLALRLGEPGEYPVVFSYSPRRFSLGLMVSFLAFLGLLASVWRFWRRG